MKKRMVMLIVFLLPVVAAQAETGVDAVQRGAEALINTC